MSEKEKNRHFPDDADYPVALMHDIDRMTHDRIKADLPDLQHSCRMIMMHLAHHDNVSQLELVRATHLKPPTVSVSLQKMEKNGLVTRRTDSTDLRVTRVSLTDKGRELDQHIISTIHEQDTTVIQILSPDELQTFMTLLRKIHSHLLEGEQEF